MIQMTKQEPAPTKELSTQRKRLMAEWWRESKHVRGERIRNMEREDEGGRAQL